MKSVDSGSSEFVSVAKSAARDDDDIDDDIDDDDDAVDDERASGVKSEPRDGDHGDGDT